MGSEGREPGTSFESPLLRSALVVSLPGLLVVVAALRLLAWSWASWAMMSAAAVAYWVAAAYALRRKVVRPIFTLANVLGAMRQGDYGVRVRHGQPDDALGLAFLEANSLGEVLRAQRIGAFEAAALVRRVVEEIDIAVFAFDRDRCLRLVNPAGVRLLGWTQDQLLGRRADDLGLGACLTATAPRRVDATFPGGSGPWELRRSAFRQDGLPHQLLVLTDIGRPLREGELEAWQRLVRVLSHEINNSLAPIRSIAGSLRDLVTRSGRPDDWEVDLTGGLAVIENRAERLSDFVASYARLMRLPPPHLALVDVEAAVRHASAAETRLTVRVAAGPPVAVSADGGQLEQLLINLIRNAADAAMETGGDVSVSWRTVDESLEVRVADEGPGILDATNLFVPFFTTKPKGAGIGLVLSRQIAEAHGGTVTLENRNDIRGAVAVLQLPLKGMQT